MIYRCEPFDLNDQQLIEGARITGEPAHMAQAIEAAVQGFRERLQRLGPQRVVNGELVIMLVKPMNYFDDYCQALVLQEVSNALGCGVARVMAPGREDLKQLASPDVQFIESCRRA